MTNPIQVGDITIANDAPMVLVGGLNVLEDAELAAEYPGIMDAASLIGGIQIQSRAGLGGNLCNATPSGITTLAASMLSRLTFRAVNKKSNGLRTHFRHNGQHKHSSKNIR